MSHEELSTVAAALAHQVAGRNWLPEFDRDSFAIALLTRDLHFLRVNSVFAASDGKVPDDYLGYAMFAIYPNPELEKIFLHAVHSKKCISRIAYGLDDGLEPKRGIGRYHWSLTPVPDDDGRPFRLLLVLQDVTSVIRRAEP